MQNSFLDKLHRLHVAQEPLPSQQQVCSFMKNLIAFLFPAFAIKTLDRKDAFDAQYSLLKDDLFQILKSTNNLANSVDFYQKEIVNKLPNIHSRLMADANAILEGDPAATSLSEIIRTYPGFYALAVHRIAHEFYKLKMPLIARILSEEAHSKTGIDIHPGATIGDHFCIDHGTGVVIGETCNIGNNVKVYQGVTLGALSVRKELASVKRHPTIENNVVIYANATILGGDTIIGKDSVIGGSVWITKSVAPASKIFHKAEQQVLLDD